MKYLAIGEMCELLNGFAFKSNEYVSEGIRVIRIANVQKGYIEDSSPCFYPEDQKYAFEKFMLRKNDLLVSLTGNVGRVGLLPEGMMPAALNQRVACLRIKDKYEIDKKYLFHLLNSNYFENACIESSNGAAQKNLSTNWLKKFCVPVPTSDEQKDIARIFDSIIELIYLNKNHLEKLDELVKSRFVEMFGRIDKIDSSFVLWADVVEIINGKDYKTNQVKSGGYPVYGTGGEIARADSFLCPANSVIVGRKGTINNPLLITEPFWNVDTAFGIVPKENKMHYLYLYWFCKQFDFSQLNKSTTLPSTTKKDLLKIEIKLPEYALQQEFADFVYQVDKLKFDLGICLFILREETFRLSG